MEVKATLIVSAASSSYPIDPHDIVVTGKKEKEKGARDPLIRYKQKGEECKRKTREELIQVLSAKLPLLKRQF